MAGGPTESAEWEAGAARFVVALDGDRADPAAPQLRVVSHLEDQLASIGEQH